MPVLIAIVVNIFFLTPSLTFSQSHALNTLNQCFIQAGNLYGVHPNVLWAIAKVESNFNPKALNKNKNGTYDIGLMQINSSWIPELKKSGMFDHRWLWNPCYNIYVGAWILNKCIQKYGNTWQAIGCYNAVSKKKRIKYANKVFHVLNNVKKSDKK